MRAAASCSGALPQPPPSYLRQQTLQQQPATMRQLCTLQAAARWVPVAATTVPPRHRCLRRRRAWSRGTRRQHVAPPPPCMHLRLSADARTAPFTARRSHTLTSNTRHARVIAASTAGACAATKALPPRRSKSRGARVDTLRNSAVGRRMGRLPPDRGGVKRVRDAHRHDAQFAQEAANPAWYVAVSWCARCGVGVMSCRKQEL